jgi:hypothetical protein
MPLNLDEVAKKLHVKKILDEKCQIMDEIKL